METITLEDFQPACNGWAVERQRVTHWQFNPRSMRNEPVGYRWQATMWINDAQSAHRRYFDQSHFSLWTKSFLLVLGTPTISLVANAAEGFFRALKIVTFANFWADRNVQIRREEPMRVADFWRAMARIFSSFTSAWRLSSFPHVDYRFEARLLETKDDLLFIALLIPTLMGRMLSALAGATCGAFSWTSGRDAAKIYATFERLQGAGFILAPCFQPSATRHGLGGNPNNPNAL